MTKIETNQTSDLRPFTGERHLLILGEGQVRVNKSINRGETFYPMTDSAGDPVVLSGTEVIFNSVIDNGDGNVRYQLEVLKGEVEYEVTQ